MKLPASTGQVAAVFHIPEPKLNDLVRRGRINPAPSVVAGRRLWEDDHVRQAARALGLPEELAQEVADAS